MFCLEAFVGSSLTRTPLLNGEPQNVSCWPHGCSEKPRVVGGPDFLGAPDELGGGGALPLAPGRTTRLQR